MFKSTCREVLTVRVPFLGELAVFRYSMPKGMAIDRRVVVDRSSPTETAIRVQFDGWDFDVVLTPWSVVNGGARATA